LILVAAPTIIIKVHPHSLGAKEKICAKAIGRSEGGMPHIIERLRRLGCNLLAPS
jgi:hypothetical protein